MLIGSDCSVATEPVAEISYNWNLVQVGTPYSYSCIASLNARYYVVIIKVYGVRYVRMYDFELYINYRVLLS